MEGGHLYVSFQDSFVVDDGQQGSEAVIGSLDGLVEGTEISFDGSKTDEDGRDICIGEANEGSEEEEGGFEVHLDDVGVGRGCGWLCSVCEMISQNR